MAWLVGRGLVPPIPAKIKKAILRKIAQRSDAPIRKIREKQKRQYFRKETAYGTDHLFGKGMCGIPEHS